MLELLVIIVVNDLPLNLLLKFVTDINMCVHIVAIQLNDAARCLFIEKAAAHWILTSFLVYFAFIFHIENVKLALDPEMVRWEDGTRKVDLTTDVLVIRHLKQLLHHHSAWCVENIVHSLLLSFEIACALWMVLLIPRCKFRIINLFHFFKTLL